MPQSNKRTASLPSPHPVGQQSCCSALLGSPPLRLCQATALHQIHTPPPPGSPPLRPFRALAPCRIHDPLGPLPLRLHWIHTPPLEPPGPQALLDLSSACDYWSHAPLGSSPLRARHQLGMRQLHPPTCQFTCPSGRASSQLYRLST
jgi:hypothetical protein